MVDRGLVERHPRKRFHWACPRRLLLHFRDRSLCFSHLLLQLLDFLLIPRVDLPILCVGFFQLVNALVASGGADLDYSAIGTVLGRLSGENW